MNVLYNRYVGTGNMVGWQATNYLDEWERSGYNVILVEVNYKYNEFEIDKIKRAILENDIDIFISACDDVVLHDSIFESLYSKGIPSLLICFDNLSVPYKHRLCCSKFDLVWLTSHETSCYFDKWRANTIFLPYAANPYTYTPSSGAEIFGLSFIGTCYGGRVSKIESLISNSIKVNLYGGNEPSAENENPTKNFLKNFSMRYKNLYNLSKFPIGRKALLSALLKSTKSHTLSNELTSLIECRSPLDFEELSSVYSRSMISLNISELWNTYLLKSPVHKVHLRTFEIPMSGGLQITSRTEEIKSYFEEDSEIILYETEEELIDKARFYLKPENHNLRNSIKASARIRAETCHTWSNRFDDIFKHLGV